MSKSTVLVRRMAGHFLSAFALTLTLAAAPLAAAEPAQQTYASPDAASAALLEIARTGDAKSIRSVFGPQGKRLGSGDPVQAKGERETFIHAYNEKHSLLLDGENRATLVLGNDEWPFPVPLVKAGNAWHFDTAAGLDEIVNRRIGRNELQTTQVLLAVVDAQQEYATEDRDGDGVREYAQKFASSPGKFDGLYWPAKAGEPASPLGPLVASAVRQGQRITGIKPPTPYRGYYYRMLTGQGSAAKGGAYSYLAGSKMIGGFAVLAYPAEYGKSGVKSFLVNHDGVVFEKDLGAGTAKAAKAIGEFNPGEGWVASVKTAAMHQQGQAPQPTP